MAAGGEDQVRLLAGYDGQMPPVAVTKQPRVSSPPPLQDLSPLTTVVNALGDNRHMEIFCLCLHKLVKDPPSPSSALLIGTTEQRAKKDESLLSTKFNGHVMKMKNHLSKLQVKVYKCEPNYNDSQVDLDKSVSEFLSQRGVSNFYLYYSGPTNERGDWSISSEAYGEQQEDYIRLDSITKKWKELKKPAGCQLIIIVDAENSYKWVEKIRKYEPNSSIIIMAPPSPESDIGAEIPFFRGQYTLSIIGGLGPAFVPASAQTKISHYVSDDLSDHRCIVC